jgi:fructokinase
MDKYRIGIDLGGTKIESILLAPDKKEVFRKRVATPGGNNYDQILTSVHGLIQNTVQKVSAGRAFSIGMGIPGAINKLTGLVHNANTTCLIGKPFKDDLERLVGCKIIMENDANCFTLIESLFGAGRGYGTVFGVIMGTGCGGGICVDQKIRSGFNGIAGEWGHFSIDPGGRVCYCGNRGCVETKISGSGVENTFFERFGKRKKMADIVTGYREGDGQCKSVFLQFLDDFGRALGGLISVLDPDIVVIGGGLSNIDEIYTRGVKRVAKYAFHEKINTPILKNRLGDSSGVIGAALLN